MGLWNKLIGSPVAEPIEAVGNVLTGLFGDKGEKLSHEQVMAKLAQEPQLAQIEINKVAAGHRSVFVAGWRPLIGWVCGLGLAQAFLVAPWASTFNFVPPATPTDVMMELVLALLGLGGLRTWEKLNGRAK